MSGRLLSAGVSLGSPPVFVYAGLCCRRCPHDLNADARNDTVPQLCGVLSRCRSSHAVCLNVVAVVASMLRCANSLRIADAGLLPEARKGYETRSTHPGGTDTPGSWSVGTTARRIQAARTAAAISSRMRGLRCRPESRSPAALAGPGMFVVVRTLRRRCWNVKHEGMEGDGVRAGGGMEGCGADGTK
ncbi:hypothetical protein BJ912DRAFT_977995 [Pholiota molesta]|nr:hypothetical protein BJ912DRAFT_977995 [Pholiota molesta]